MLREHRAKETGHAKDAANVEGARARGRRITLRIHAPRSCAVTLGFLGPWQEIVRRNNRCVDFDNGSVQLVEVGCVVHAPCHPA